MNQIVAIVVDGMSTASHYAPLFRGNGIPVVHVQSSTDMPPLFRQTFVPSDYITNIVFAGDFEQLVSALSGYRVLCVLPGGDAAIELSDKLAVAVNAVHRNELEGSLAKYDKFEMIEALHRRQIPAARQRKVSSMQEALETAKSEISLPIVLKPLQSAGGDGVRVCANTDDLFAWLQHSLGRKTIFGKTSDEVVLQEYVNGKEYMVDTVSLNGTHRLLCVWEVTLAPGAHPFPLFCRTLPSGDKREGELLAYVSEVLTAVGHQFGPAHTEVRVGEQGPRLVEVNCRLHGRLDPSLTVRAIGTSQPLSTVLAVLGGQPFATPAPASPPSRGICMQALLVTKTGGRLEHDPDVSYLQRLKSFHSVQTKLEVGKTFPPTISLTTVLGVVHLYNVSEEQLMLDCEAVLKSEGHMFTLKQN